MQCKATVNVAAISSAVPQSRPSAADLEAALAVAMVSPSDVVHSFTTEFGEDVDCIPYDAQPALKRPGMRNLPRAQPPADPIDATASHTYLNGGMPVPDDVGFRGVDARGHLRRCPEETVAIRHLGPAQLAGFATLAEMYANVPGSNEPPRVGSTEAHQYVGALQFIDNWGESAALEVWQPGVSNAGEFSLSQMTVSGGSGVGNDFQTIEAGWHVYPDHYSGSTATRFFVYSTASNYHNASDSCYNNECGNFVLNPNDSTYCLGCITSPVSTVNGNHFVINLSLIKDHDNGDWWIMRENHWVGHFPRSNFAAIANSAPQVAWYGEIVNTEPSGVHTGTHMGNGIFPASGDAAYMDWMKSVTRPGYSWATAAASYASYPGGGPPPNTGITDSRCYNGGSITTVGAEQFFYFGGPGNSVMCQ